MLTRGKRPRSGAVRGVAIAALVIGLLIAAELTVRGDGYDMALQLQRNVALLTVTSGDKTHYGFGFVVGERDGRLLVVTARHVVVCESPPGCEVTIVARFYGEADVLPATPWADDEDVDLALLSIEAPPDYTWEAECFDGADPAPETRVWSVGLDQRWEIPLRSTPGYIKGVDVTGAQLSIVNAVVRPGSSGAPLVSERGIVGMIQTNAAGTEVRALWIGVIRNAVEKWGATWGLSECENRVVSADTVVTSGAEIRGRVLYDGVPISDTTQADAFFVRMYELNTNEEVPVQFEYDRWTSEFVLRGVPSGQYNADIYIDAGYPFGDHSAGDFDGFTLIWAWRPPLTVSPYSDVYERDYPVALYIHLIQPIDNQRLQVRGGDLPLAFYTPGYDPSAQTFVWEAVPRAAYYIVQIFLHDSTHESPELQMETRLEVCHFSPGLAVTAASEYYAFSLVAYNERDEVIGVLSIFHPDDFNSALLFTVNEHPD